MKSRKAKRKSVGTPVKAGFADALMEPMKKAQAGLAAAPLDVHVSPPPNGNPKVSELEDAQDRLTVAVEGLSAYVEDLVERLRPIVRQGFAPPRGPKVEREPMASQVGARIAADAEGVEGACLKLHELLETLAV